MANTVFNIALGQEKTLYDNVVNNTPANSALILTLLKTTVADDALRDFTSFQAMLADAGVEECDFTNFVRKPLTDAVITAAVIDNVANDLTLTIPDQEFTNAGGAANNAIVKAVIGFEPDTTAPSDANIIPISHHDVSFTTDGNTFNLRIPATGTVVITS